MRNFDWEIDLNSLLNRTRRSARTRNLAFDLDRDFLRSLWEEQNGRCAVSGIAFSDERHDHAFVKAPFAPSLDRIDSSEDYVEGNVRLVCMAANFALNEWGDDVLRRLAHGVIETEREVRKDWFRKQRRKLRDAEKAAETMTGAQLARQKKVMAGLKASMTKGPARLAGAAFAARHTRRNRRGK